MTNHNNRNSPTSYRIYSWNVNGIRATLKRGFLEWAVNKDIDILCLQETKVQEDQLPKKLQHPPNITTYWLSPSEVDPETGRIINKGRNGVAAMCKEGYEPLLVDMDLDIDKFAKEGRIMGLKYPQFWLFNVYFPNGKRSKERLEFKMKFYDDFYKLCKALLDDGESVIVCGDVNTAHKEIDLEHPKPNSKYSGFLPKERAWIDDFLELGFVDTFRHIHGDIPRQYTWWAARAVSKDGRTARERNVGWRIDYFYISQDLVDNLIAAQIHGDVMGSDHCPISIELRF